MDVDLEVLKKAETELESLAKLLKDTGTAKQNLSEIAAVLKESAGTFQEASGQLSALRSELSGISASLKEELPSEVGAQLSELKAESGALVALVTAHRDALEAGLGGLSGENSEISSALKVSHAGIETLGKKLTEIAEVARKQTAELSATKMTARVSVGVGIVIVLQLSIVVMKIYGG